MNKALKAELEASLKRHESAIRTNERLRIAQLILRGVQKGKDEHPDYDAKVADALTTLAGILVEM